MSVSLERKATPLPAWHLTDSAAMVAALTELSATGWRGTVGYNPDSAVWQIDVVSADGTTEVGAIIGDWLILDGQLSSVSDAERVAKYNTAT